MAIRSFIILLVLIPLLLIVGAAVYFLGPWHKQPTKIADQKQQITALISEPVISPVLSFDGEKVWYMTGQGKMFRIPLPQSLPQGEGKEDKDSPPSMGGNEGRVEPEEYLLPEPVSNPVQIIWPPTGNDFIVELPDRFALYDSASKKFHHFPPQLQKSAFLSDPSKIIYDWETAEGRHELKTSDKNGENFRKIADLRQPDYQIVPSPTKEEVVLFGSDNLEPSYLILVDLGTGEFKDIDQKDFYQGVVFSPDGHKLLASRANKLVVYELDTFRATDLGSTLDIDRAAWSKNSGELILAKDDGFVKYDLSSSQQTELYKFKSGEQYKPKSLMVHPQKNILFFVDQNSGYLYKVEY